MPRKFVDIDGLTHVFTKIKTLVAENSGGKRASRLTVGTSTNGWTTKDCDYLCDGTSDQTEINNAIAALPSTGGEIVLLDGTYNLAAPIRLNKNNITLSGNGAGTKLVRAFDGTYSNDGLIKVASEYCVVRNLALDGAKATYSVYDYNRGIMVEADNCTIEGTIVNDCAGYGIYTNNQNVIIKGNRCSGDLYGIYMSGEHCTVTGNICNYNTSYGIDLWGDYNIITGNVARFNTERNISLYDSAYNVVSNNNVAVVDGDSVVPEYALLIQDPSYSHDNLCIDNIIGIGVAEDNSETYNVMTKTPKIIGGTEEVSSLDTSLKSEEIYLRYD